MGKRKATAAPVVEAPKVPGGAPHATASGALLPNGDLPPAGHGFVLCEECKTTPNENKMSDGANYE